MRTTGFMGRAAALLAVLLLALPITASYLFVERDGIVYTNDPAPTIYIEFIPDYVSGLEGWVYERGNRNRIILRPNQFAPWPAPSRPFNLWYMNYTNPATMLPEGEFTFELRNASSGGNYMDVPYMVFFTVDTVGPPPPSIVHPADGEFITDSEVLVYGTSEPYSNVTVRLYNATVFTPDNLRREVQVASYGTFQPFNTNIYALKEILGPQQIRVSGDLSAYAGLQVEFMTHPAPHYRIESASGYDVVNDETIVNLVTELSGPVRVNDQIRLYTSPYPSGYFEATMPLPLGDSYLTSRATDLLANSSGYSMPVHVVRDLGGPNMTVLSPLSGAVTGDELVQVRIIMTDDTSVALSTLSLTTDFGVFGCSSSEVVCTPSTDAQSITFNFTPTSEWSYDTHTVTFVGADLGGASTQDSWSFEVRSDVPSDPQIIVPGSQLHNGIIYTTDATPEFYINFTRDSDVRLTRLYLNFALEDVLGDSEDLGNDVFRLILPDPVVEHGMGDYEILQMSAQKMLGDFTFGPNGTFSQYFVVDTTNPVIHLDSSYATVTEDFMLQGTFTDNHLDPTGGNITFSFNDVVSGMRTFAAEITSSDEWRVSVDLDPGGSRTVPITAAICDKAGNCGSATSSLVIDTGGPTLTVDDSQAQGWTNSPPLDVLLTATDESAGSGVSYIRVCETSCQDYPYSGPLQMTYSSDRDVTVTATAYDFAGNPSGPVTYNVQIDTTRPVTGVVAEEADLTPYSSGAWADQDIYVMFDAVDSGISVSGINDTRYCIDADNTCVPDASAPAVLVLNDSSLHYVRYRSSDNAGNVEDVRSFNFNIDSISPVLEGYQLTPSDILIPITERNGVYYSGDPRILLTGSVTEAHLESVTVELNGGSSRSATIVGSDYLSQLNLPEGPSTVVVRARDLAGNLDSYTLSFMVDSTPPGMQLVSPRQRVNTTELTMIISTTRDAWCEASYGATVRNMSSSDNTTHSYSLTIPPSSYDVDVICRDVTYGTYSSDTYTFIYDVTPPTLTLDLSNPYYPGSIVALEAGGTITDLLVSADEPVVCSYEGGMDYVIPGDTNNRSYYYGMTRFTDRSFARNHAQDLTIPINDDGTDGTFTYVVNCEDEAGNFRSGVYFPPSITFIVELNELYIYDARPQAAVDSLNVPISFRTNKLATCTEDSSGANAPIGEGTLLHSKTITYSSDGQKDINIQCVATEGPLLSAQDQISFVIDTSPPTGLSISIPGSVDIGGVWNVSGSFTLTMGATDSQTNVSSYTYQLAGVDSRQMTTSLSSVNYSGLADGTYIFTFSASDFFGHESADASFTLLRDSEGPQVDITSPANTSLQDVQDVAITVSASDTVGLHTVWSNDLVVSHQSGSLYAGTFAGADGQHTVTVYANDTAGHMASDSVTFTIDTTPPEPVHLVSPDDGAYLRGNVVLRWQDLSADEASYVAEYSTSNDFSSGVVSHTLGRDATNISIPSLLTGTTYYWRVYAYDEAGNSDSASAEIRSFIYDNVAGPVVIVSPREDAIFNTTSLLVEGFAEPGASVEIVVYDEDLNSDSATVSAQGVVAPTALTTVVATARAGATNIMLDGDMASYSYVQFADLTNYYGIRNSTRMGPFTILTLDKPLEESPRQYDTAFAYATKSFTGFFSSDMPFSEGYSTVYARATDNAGNWGDDEVAGILVDLQPPTVSEPSPSQTLASAGTVSAMLADTGGSGIGRYAMYINGTPVGSTLRGGLLEHRDALGDGSYQVQVFVWDAAGNMGQLGWSFTLDSSLPTATVSVEDAVVDTDYDPDRYYVGSDSATATYVFGSDVVVESATVSSGSLVQSQVSAREYAFELSGLREGSSTLTVRARNDISGSTAIPFQAEIISDTTNPYGLRFTSIPAIANHAAAIPVSGAFTETNPSSATLSGDIDPVALETSSPFTATINLLGSDGVKEVILTVTDVLGHEAQVSRNITLDTTQPDVTVTSADLVEIGGRWFAIDGTMDLLVATEPSTMISIYANGTLVRNAVTDYAGHYSYTLNSLFENYNELYVTATDAAGNTGTSNTVEVYVDNTEPQVTFLSPEEGEVADDMARSVQIDVEDALSGVDPASVRLIITNSQNGATDVTGWLQFSYADGRMTFSPLPFPVSEGENTLTVRLSDMAGVPGGDSITFRVDTQAPAEPMFTLLSNNDVPVAIQDSSLHNLPEDYNIFRFDFEEQVDVSSLSVSRDGSPAGFSYLVASDTNRLELILSGLLSEGEWAVSFNFVATDNGHANSLDLSFTIDRTAPGQVSQTLPANGAFTPSPVTLSWSELGSDEAAYNIEVFRDASLTDRVTGLQSSVGPDTTSISYDRLSDGQVYYWRVYAVDAAGNSQPTAASVRSFTPDSSAGPLVLLYPRTGLETNASEIEAEGFAEPGSQVTLSMGTESDTVTASGIVSPDLTVAVYEPAVPGSNVVRLSGELDAYNGYFLQFDDLHYYHIVGVQVQPSLFTQMILDRPLATGSSPNARLYAAKDFTGFFSTQMALDQGYNNIFVQAVDRAGNPAQASAQNILYDPSAPEAVSWSPQDTLADFSRIELIISDGPLGAYSGISYVEMYLDGTQVTPTRSPRPLGEELVYYRPGDLEDATHEVEVYMGDEAGNYGYYSWSFTLDSSLPTATVSVEDAVVDTDYDPDRYYVGSDSATATYVFGSDVVVESATVSSGSLVQSQVSAREYAFELSGLREGSSTLTVRARNDLPGSSSLPFYADLMVDTLPPDRLRMSSLPGLVNYFSLPVTGTFTEPNPQSVELSGDLDSASASLAPGGFSGQVQLASGDGEKEVTVTVEDVLSHSSTASAHVVLDTQAPPITISTNDVIDVSGDTYGTSDRITVLAQCETNSLLDLTVNSVTTQSDRRCAEGSYTFSNIPLVEGSNEISVDATDAAGNSQESNTLSVYGDSTPPTVGFGNPLDGQVLTSSAVTVSATATDSGSGVEDLRMWFNGIEVTTWPQYSVSGSEITFDVPVALIVPGMVNTVELFAVDSVGNGASSQLTFRYDPDAPSEPVMNLVHLAGTSSLEIERGDYINAISSYNIFRFEFDETVDVTGYTVTLGGSNVAGISTSAASSTDLFEIFLTGAEALSEGNWSVSLNFEANDNHDTNSFTTWFVVDRSPPSAVSLTLDGGATYTNSRQVTVSGSASDSQSAIQTIELSNNGATFTPFPYDEPPGAWTLAGEGLMTVHARFRSLAGLLSNVITSQITVDTTPPPVPKLYSPPAGESCTSQSEYQVIGYVGESDVTVLIMDERGNNYSSQVVTYGSLCSGDLPVTRASGNLVYVSDAVSPFFSAGNYIQFSGHSRDNFERYYITSVNAIPGDDEVVLQTPLEGSVRNGELVRVCDSMYPSGWFNITIGLDATNSIRAVAYDHLGLIGPLTAERILRVDSEPPVASDGSPSGLTGDSSPTISARVVEYPAIGGSGFGTIEMRINGTAVPLLRVGDVISYVPGVLADGLYYVDVYVSDNAGGSDTLSWNFTIDSNVPQINITVDDSTPYPGFEPMRYYIDLTNASVMTTFSEESRVTEIGIVGLSMTYDVPGTGSEIRTDITGLSEGPNTFTVTAEKLLSGVAFGPPGDAQAQIWVDTMAPRDVAFSLSPTQVNSRYMVPLQGSFSEENVLRVELDGDVENGPVTALNGASLFSGTVNLTSGDGLKTVNAVVIDMVGHRTTASTQINLDTNMPNATIVAVGAVDVSGQLYTASRSVEIGVTSDPLASLELIVDGVTRSSGASDASGQYMFTFYTEEGPHVIQVNATDSAGNTGESNTVYLQVDLTGPRIEFVSPDDGQVVISPNTTLRMHVSDADAGPLPQSISLLVNSVEVAGGAGYNYSDGTVTFRPEPYPVAEGFNTVELSMTDVLGNPSSGSIEYRVDPNAPELPILFLTSADLGQVGVARGSYLATPSEYDIFRFIFSEEVTLTGESILLDGSPSAHTSWSTTNTLQSDLVIGSGLSEGNWSVSLDFEASDNAQSSSYTTWFVVDRTPPGVVSLASPASGSIHNGNVMLAWEDLGEDEVGYKVELSTEPEFASLMTGSPHELEDGVTSLGIPASQFTSGRTYYWRVYAHDLAGNEDAYSATVWSFTFDDTIAPVLIISPPANTFTNDSAAQVEGFADPLSAMEIVLTSSQVTTAESSAEGFVAPMGTAAVLETARSGESAVRIAGDVSAYQFVQFSDRNYYEIVAAPIFGPYTEITLEKPLDETAAAGSEARFYTSRMFTGFFSEPMTLGEGSNTVFAMSTDAAGNTAHDEVLNVMLDTSGPQITDMSPTATLARVSSVSALVSDDSSGVAAATMYVNGEQVAATLRSGLVEYRSSLADGSYSVLLVVRDLAGNYNTATWGFTVDSDLPGATITVDDSIEMPDYSPDRYYINSSSPTVNVEFDADVVVESVGVAGGTLTETQMSAGNYVYEVSGLSEGQHLFSMTARKDIDGSSAAPFSANIVVDISAPDTLVLSLTPLTADSEVEITGSFRETNFDRMTITGDITTSDVHLEGNRFAGTVTLSPGDGPKTVRLDVYDLVGHRSHMESTTVADTQAPSLTAEVLGVVGVGGRDYVADSRVDVGVVCESGLVLTLMGGDRVRSGVCSGGSFVFAGVGIAEEFNELWVESVDLAGNVGVSNHVVVYGDVTGPSVVFVRPLDGDVVTDPEGVIEVAVGDGGAGVDGASVRLVVNDWDVTGWPGYTYTSGIISFSPAPFPVQNHSNEVVVYVEDQLGNPAEQRMIFIVDQDAPARPSITLTDPTLPPIALSDGSHLSIESSYNVFELSFAEAVNVTGYSLRLGGVDVTDVRASPTQAITDFSLGMLGAEPLEEGGWELTVNFVAVDNAHTNSITIGFNVDRTAPSTVAQQSPQDSSILGGDIEFSWDHLGDDEEYYILEISTDQSFSGLVYETRVASEVSSVGVSDREFVQGQAYYWRVYAGDGAGNEEPDTADQRSFTYDAAAGPVIIYRPITGYDTNESAIAVEGFAEPYSHIDLAAVDYLGTYNDTTTASASAPGAPDATLQIVDSALSGSEIVNLDGDLRAYEGQYLQFSNPREYYIITGVNYIPLQYSEVELDRPLTSSFSGSAYLYSAKTFAGYYSASLTLTDGSNRILARATDRAGNWASASAGDITYDTSPPSISEETPKYTTGETSLRVSALLSEDGSGLSYAAMDLDGVPMAVTLASSGGDTLAYYQARNLGDGTHHASITAWDRAGNSASSSWEFVVDTQFPTATITVQGAVVREAYDPDRHYLESSTPSIRVSFDSGVVVDSAGMSGGTLTQYQVSSSVYTYNSSELTEGIHRFTIRARKDLPGSSPIPFYADVIIDNSAPSNLAITTLPSPVQDPVGVPLAGSFTETNFEGLTVGGDISGYDVGTSANRFSGDVDLEAADGMKAVVVTVSDILGHNSSVEGEVEVDSEEPQLTAEVLGVVGVGGRDYVADSRVDVGVVCESGLVLTLMGGDRVRSGVCSGGSFVFAGVGIAEEFNELWVESVDLAGNVGVSNHVVVYGDVTGPSVVFVRPLDGDVVTDPEGVIEVAVGDGGAGVDGASVRLVVNDWDVTGWPGYTYTSGVISFDPEPFPVREGPNSVTLYSSDLLGNPGRGSISFVVDTLAPNAPALSLSHDAGTFPPLELSTLMTADAAYNQLSFEFDELVNITGYSVEYGGVEYTNIRTSATSSVDVFNIGLLGTDPLSEGEWEVSVNFVAVDNAHANSYSASFTVDRTPPVAGSLLLNGGDEYSTTSGLQVQGSASDAVTSVEVIELSNDGRRFTPFAYTDQPILWDVAGEGFHRVYARFSDMGGLLSATINSSITVDTIGPAAPVIYSPPAGESWTSLSSYNVIGYVGESDVDIVLFDESGQNLSVQHVAYDSVCSGTINIATASGTTILVPDAAVPYFMEDSFVEFSGHKRANFERYMITSVRSMPGYDEVTLEEPLEGVVRSNEGVVICDTRYPAGWFNISVPLVDRTSIRAVAYDRLGIEGGVSDARVLVRDVTAPTLTYLQPAADTVTAQAVPSVILRVSDTQSGVADAQLTVDSVGYSCGDLRCTSLGQTMEIEFNAVSLLGSALGYGTHSFDLTVTDAAGNPLNFSWSLEISSNVTHEPTLHVLGGTAHEGVWYVDNMDPAITAAYEDDAPSLVHLEHAGLGFEGMGLDTDQPVNYARADNITFGIILQTPALQEDATYQLNLVSYKDVTTGESARGYHYFPMRFDTIGPFVNFSSSPLPSTLTTSDVSVSGWCRDYNMDYIELTGDVSPTVTLCGSNGRWAASVDLVGIEQGARTITVTAYDMVGHTSSATSTILFDFQPPTVQVAAISDDNDTTEDAIDDDGLVYLTGLNNSGGAQWCIINWGDGSPSPEFAASVTSRMHSYAEGTWTASYSCRDAAGNWAVPVTKTIDVDMNGPSITISSVVPATTNRFANATIILDETPATMSVSVIAADDSCDRTSMQGTTYRYACDVSNVSMEGTLTLRVMAADAHGHQTTAQRQVGVDTLPPTISVPDTEFVTADTTQRVSIQTNENAHCRWSTDQESYWAMLEQFTTGEGTRNHATDLALEPGLTTYYFACADAYGNANSAGQLASLTVDFRNEPPSLDNITISPIAYSDLVAYYTDTMDITVSGTSDVGAQIRLLVDGTLRPGSITVAEPEYLNVPVSLAGFGAADPSLVEGSTIRFTSGMDLDVVLVGGAENYTLPNRNSIEVDFPTPGTYTFGLTVPPATAVLDTLTVTVYQADTRFSYDASVSEGRHFIMVRATDEWGHTTDSDLYQLYVDTLDPVITLQSPISITGDTSPDIVLTLSDAVSGLDMGWTSLTVIANETYECTNVDLGSNACTPASAEVIWDGEELTFTTGDQLTFQDTGEVSLIAAATDNVGHAASEQFSFAVDTSAPTVQSISISEAFDRGSVWYSRSAQPLATIGFDSPVVVEGASMGGAANTSESGLLTRLVWPYRALAEGEYSLAVNASRIGGGTMGSWTWSFVVDLNDPQVDISPDVPTLVGGSQLEVYGSCYDANMDRIEIETPSNSFVADCEQGTYNASGIYLGSRSGTYEVEVRAYDLSGRQSSAAINVTYDNVGPASMYLYPLADATARPWITVRGTTDPDVRYVVLTALDTFSQAVDSVRIDGVSGENPMISAARLEEMAYPGSVLLLEGDVCAGFSSGRFLQFANGYARYPIESCTSYWDVVDNNIEYYSNVRLAEAISGSYSPRTEVSVYEYRMPEGYFEANISLTEGYNLVRAEAFDEAGNSAAASDIVRFDPDLGLDIEIVTPLVYNNHYYIDYSTYAANGNAMVIHARTATHQASCTLTHAHDEVAGMFSQAMSSADGVDHFFIVDASSCRPQGDYCMVMGGGDVVYHDYTITCTVPDIGLTDSVSLLVYAYNKISPTQNGPFTCEEEVRGQCALGDIQGTITSAMSGAALQGALVSAGGSSAYSDPSGSYSIQGIPSGSQTFTVEMDGYVPHSRDISVAAGTATTHDASLTPVGAVSGYIRSSLGGPISGAQVEAGTGYDITDSQGHYLIENIASNANLIVYASAAGFASDQFNVFIPEGQLVAGINLSLLPLGNVSGTVTNTEGVGINGATVTASSVSARTDINGDFLLTNIMPGAHNVRAEARGYWPESVLAVVAAGQTTANVDLQLSERGKGNVTGYVKEASGAPIPGTLVEVPAGEAALPFATSVVDGYYIILEVFEGSQRVTASHLGYDTITRSLYVLPERNNRLNITMTQPADLYGTVMLVGQSMPFSGITVTLDSGARTATAASDGTYIFTEVSAGTHIVGVAKEGFGEDEATVTMPGGVDTQLNFILHNQEGYIVDSGWN